MRIAVLADIHGNVPALRAVLHEVDGEGADALVVAGDVVAGPLVRESLDLLSRRPEPLHWISGTASARRSSSCAPPDSFDEQLERSLLDPAAPDWVSGSLERTAGRG